MAQPRISDPVELLALNREGCETVRLGNILGKGKGGGRVVRGKGYIFSRDSKIKETSYAVKLSALEVSFRPFGHLSPVPYSKFRGSIESATGGVVSFERVAGFNGVYPESFETIAPGYGGAASAIRWIVPEFYLGCVSPGTSYPRFDGRGSIVVEVGDVVCRQNITEAVLATYVSETFRSATGTPNPFIETFNIAVCPKTETSTLADGKKRTTASAETYQFMEIVEGTLIEYFNSSLFPQSDADREVVLSGIFGQLLDGIETFQTEGIVHGDLHLENVFFVSGSGVKIGDGSAIPTVKIGDWGLGCKYSSPKILNVETMKSGYAQKDAVPWLPNWFAPEYDLFLVAWLFWGLFPRSELFSRVMTLAISGPTFTRSLTFSEIRDSLEKSRLINLKTGRPDLRKLSSLKHFTVAAIRKVL